MKHQNATVETSPKLLSRAQTPDGSHRLTYYTMDVSGPPGQEFPDFTATEPFEFVLSGDRVDTRDLVPGTPIHITYINRGPGQRAKGYGILVLRHGICHACEREDQVQITPEYPDQQYCARCAATRLEPGPGRWDYPEP